MNTPLSIFTSIWWFRLEFVSTWSHLWLFHPFDRKCFLRKKQRWKYGSGVPGARSIRGNIQAKRRSRRERERERESLVSGRLLFGSNETMTSLLINASPSWLNRASLTNLARCPQRSDTLWKMCLVSRRTFSEFSPLVGHRLSTELEFDFCPSTISVPNGRFQKERANHFMDIKFDLIWHFLVSH